MYTDVTDPFTLYITNYNIVSWGFIEACATCSPINTYYHIKIFKSKMPCSQQHSANLGCANG